MTFIVPRLMEKVPFGSPLTVLLDSGSTSTWINHRCLPNNVHGRTVLTITGSTMAGTFKSTKEIVLSDMILPELRQNTYLPKCPARIFNADCRYDMILGRDALRSLHITLDFDQNLVKAPGTQISMKPFPSIPPSQFSALAINLMLDHMENFLSDDSHSSNDDAMTPAHASENEELESLPASFDHDEHDTHAQILPSAYDPADLQSVAQSCTHLSPQQRNELYKVLSQYPQLFDGILRVFPDEKIHLDIDPSVKPHRSRAYPIPKSQLNLFKQELDRLVRINVLEPTGRSEWISGSFIIPKKDTRIRWISDFRALNKALRRKVYPIPRIQEILARRTGYAFLSKLDISMQYYTFELDDASKDLCTIATPFGLYRYCRLPMGVNQSPDIAQEIMERVLRAIEDIEVYIDDIACFSNDFDSHMALLDQVFNRLQNHGFAINPLKCEWAVQETDFLGHWLTPTGLKPWTKKIQAILNLQPPTNIKQLRSFLGLVTYYRDMWPRRSHILAPLTDLLRTPKTFRCNDECTAAFQKMKALIASDALLAYPDHNKPFHIETDASDLQLGAIIKQDNRPVAYYTRKLNSAQKNYTTIEKELLSIVETFREFRSMLLGAKINVYTDHKNLTHRLSQFTTQRVMRWRLLLEEYGPKFYYLKGPRNIVADALSRVPTATVTSLNHTPSNAGTRPLSQTSSVSPCNKTLDELTIDTLAEGLLAMPACEAHKSEALYSEAVPDPTVLWQDCCLFHPRFDARGNHPFHFSTFHHYQQNDKQLLKTLTQKPGRFFKQSLGGYDIICIRQSPPPTSAWHIVIPDAMLHPLVAWYHEALIHSVGMDRLEAILKRHLWHPNLRDMVHRVISSCPICPQVRLSTKPHGHLAPREAPIAPWSEVHVDCIGPWTVTVNNVKLRFEALTCIDPVTNLVEISRFQGPKTSDTARALFENQCKIEKLSAYCI